MIHANAIHFPPEPGAVIQEPFFFTPEELTAFLNVPERWVEKNTYRLPGRTKIGRYVRYRRADIERQLLTGSVLFPKAEPKIRLPRHRGIGNHWK